MGNTADVETERRPDAMSTDAVFDQQCRCGRAECGADFAAMSSTPSEPVRRSLRNRIVECHLHLAQRIAAGFRRTGVPVDDLTQVSALAMVQAVDRFDPGRGIPFSGFAVPTVAGAIKRYFRDNRWSVHISRSVKERYLEVQAATEELTGRLGRPPASSELAAHLGYDEGDVLEDRRAGAGRTALSLDAPVAGNEDGNCTLGVTMGAWDGGFEAVENVESLRPLLAELPPRELRAVLLRFFGNLTQSQIADRIGCSQMHVSRILRTALDRLRRGLADADADAGDGDGKASTRHPARQIREKLAQPSSVEPPHDFDVDTPQDPTGPAPQGYNTRPPTAEMVEPDGAEPGAAGSVDTEQRKRCLGRIRTGRRTGTRGLRRPRGHPGSGGPAARRRRAPVPGTWPVGGRPRYRDEAATGRGPPVRMADERRT